MRLRNLLSLLAILFVASIRLSPCVQAQGASLPAVVLLRQAESDEGSQKTHAVLIDRRANPIGTIDSVGVGSSVSTQGNVVLNPAKNRIWIAENKLNQLSEFDASGSLIRQIPIENLSGVVVSPNGEHVACAAGELLNKRETIVINTQSGAEVKRYPFGGVAMVHDAADGSLWTAGIQLMHFDWTGDVHLRRPLTRLDPEIDHPTVINARNWCATTIAIEPNQNDWWRSIWVTERMHPDVRGSKNRLFALDSNGQTTILVELGDIKPTSMTCAKTSGSTHCIFVVDYVTGDLVQFDSDGEQMRRKSLGARRVASGPEYGLWVATEQSILRIDPKDLAVLNEHEFDSKASPIGLAVR